MKKRRRKVDKKIIVFIGIILFIIALTFFYNFFKITGNVIAVNERKLVAYYTFNVSANDSSGNGNNGVNNGANLVTGKIGKAYSFSGTSYIEVPDSSSLDVSEIALSAWIYPTAFTSDRKVISKASSDSYQLGINGSGNFYIGINKDGWKNCVSAIPLKTSVWSHISGTYDGSEISIYLNGTFLNKCNLAGSIPAGNGPLFIGKSYKGYVDEVKIFNYALKPKEIKYVFNGTVLCNSNCFSEGNKTCDGNGFKVCGSYNSDSCLIWSQTLPCTSSQQCFNGICYNPCVENDWQYSIDPGVCPSSGKQTKTWTKVGQCIGGISKPSSEIANCDYAIPTCTSFTYSNWGACFSNGIQNRSIISSSPISCQGGNPETSMACTYVPPCNELDWQSSLSPLNCPISGKQNKNWTKIGQCNGGVIHLSEVVLCTPNCAYNYSNWGVCNSNGLQNRTVINSWPSGCIQNPELSQPCNYLPLCEEDNWIFNYTDEECSASLKKNITWIKIGNCQGGIQKDLIEEIDCDPSLAVCTNWTYSNWSECDSSDIRTRDIVESFPSGCQEGEPEIAEICCVPDCSNSECGDDGCGGSCGECSGDCEEGICNSEEIGLEDQEVDDDSEQLPSVDEETDLSLTDQNKSEGFISQMGSYLNSDNNFIYFIIIFAVLLSVIVILIVFLLFRKKPNFYPNTSFSYLDPRSLLSN